MRFRVCNFVVLLFGLTVACAGQDGPPYVPCLDTWAINSSTVFVAQITEVCSVSRCGVDNEVSLKVERALKGAPGLQLKLQIDAPPAALKDWKRRKASLLVFGGLNVDPLSSLAGPADALDLSDLQQGVLTAQMNVLHDPDQVLAAAARAIEQHPDGKRVATFPRMLLSETMGLEQGAPPVTLVPVDVSLESWARGVLLGPLHPAIDAALRPEAVRALRFFPSPENIMLLIPMLEDASNSTVPAEFNLGVKVRTYPVRAEAYTVLREWKVAVAEPVTSEQSSEPDAVRNASLSNHGGMVGQAEIKKLSQFANLERLDLVNDHLTAQAYRAIPSLAGLKALGLGGSNVTDNKLDDLAQLVHLQALDLTATKITDAGLKSLATLPELRSLNLTRTRATAYGVRQLQQQRPEMVIEYR